MSTLQTDTLRGQSVLVTGGSGFIGAELVRQLVELGALVTVQTRYPKLTRGKLPASVVVLEDLLRLNPSGYDAVVNLAGAPIMDERWSKKRQAELLASRVDTTELLLEHLRNLNKFPEVVVSGSAIGFYGDTGNSAADETAAGGEGFAAQLCRSWEASAQGFAAEGARLCLLRTGVVLANGGGALQRMLTPFKLGLGGPIGSGKQWMSWIHRNDLVRMILWLLVDGEVRGPVNAVAPEPVTNKMFTRTLAEVLNRPCFFPMPAAAVRLLFGQAGQELLLASNRVNPSVALSRQFSYQFSVLDEALIASV
ncbi:TIGR01777 family oxidoreductase [Gilvimarinus sp. SDUM040013]|uniref:TIGR01777 family oxidoreductase n=1 Tax=Gilvimarinus gilvus TaxID=3058038 RepID=A0ABU4RTA0_9GAMM|nr:TIGR01777 family oxidoreductase [Gilvimarinus sp. SDUM040013]MDO3386991.1 TIGR01777 family oxidoreductase [Gilvimarinus sp. SDUM040013]MDX6848115.1 TIGR01777 family oxidoreductase [Gilvimarinus sp. SDUM040013]